MSYRVTAALVVVKDQSGRNHHCYAGSVVPWLNEEQRDHFLRMGLVEELDAPAAPVAPVVSAPTGKPARVAPKEDWVTFAVANGHDRGEAEGLTKQELIDLLG